MADIDWEAAWAKSGLALSPQHVSQSYVETPTLSLAQEQLSRRVVAALAWLGRHNPNAIAHAISPSAAAAAPIPSSARGGVQAVTPHFVVDSSWWPVPPFVIDHRAGDHLLPNSNGVDGIDYELLRRPVMTVATESYVEPRAGWGRYAEDRGIYTTEHFTASANPRTVHLGVDVSAPVGTAVTATLAGRVHSVARNMAAGDYGPCVVLQHTLTLRETDEADDVNVVFYTLYGHMSIASLVLPDGTPRITPGQRIAAGDVLGWIGDASVNGGWHPHLHFQLDTELDHGGWFGDYPGVCSLRDWRQYITLCPDPNLLLRCQWIAPIGWDASATGSGITAVRVVE